MKTLGRSAVSVTVGFAVAATFAVIPFASESSAMAPLRWVSYLFQLPGGAVLPWTHYGAPSRFKQLTDSDGPAAAYLWMMSISFIVWLAALSILAFVCLWRLRPRTI